MDLLDLMTETDSADNDFGSEAEYINLLTDQFKLSENNLSKIDLLEQYTKKFLNIDLDKLSSITNFEMELDNEEKQESYFLLKNHLIHLFKTEYGIDLTQSTDDICDFELLYILYNTFVLNLNKTIAYFIDGMRSVLNPASQTPEKFTLAGCYKDRIQEYKILNIIENNESTSFESIINNVSNNDFVENDTPDSFDSIRTYIHSSLAFEDLFNKTVLNDSVFDIDKFFETISYSDNSVEANLLKDLYDDCSFGIDEPLFKYRIRTEVSTSVNMDNLEDLYRNLSINYDEDQLLTNYK